MSEGSADLVDGCIAGSAGSTVYTCDPCSIQPALQSLGCWLLSLEVAGGCIGQDPFAVCQS